MQIMSKNTIKMIAFIKYTIISAINNYNRHYIHTIRSINFMNETVIVLKLVFAVLRDSLV